MTTPQNIHRINSSYNNNGMQQQLHSATSDKWGQDSVANAVNSPAFNGSSGKQQHSSSVAVDSTRPSAAAAVTMSSIAQQVDEIEKNHASNLNAAEEDLNIFVKQLLEQMVLLLPPFLCFFFLLGISRLSYFLSFLSYTYIFFSCLFPFWSEAIEIF
jgi:hypothetical protein